MHDFFTHREYANLEETREQDEELKALLREQELLRDLPQGPPPWDIESNVVVRAIDKWHSRDVSHVRGKSTSCSSWASFEWKF